MLDMCPPLAGGGTARASGSVWQGRLCDCSLNRIGGNSLAFLPPVEKQTQITNKIDGIRISTEKKSLLEKIQSFSRSRNFACTQFSVCPD